MRLIKHNKQPARWTKESEL